MHLRLPAIDQGKQAGLWAVFFFFLLWIGMLAVGVSNATAFILALVAAGGDLPLRPSARRRLGPASASSAPPTARVRAGARARCRGAPPGAPPRVGRPPSSLSSTKQCSSRSSEAEGFGRLTAAASITTPYRPEPRPLRNPLCQGKNLSLPSVRWSSRPSALGSRRRRPRGACRLLATGGGVSRSAVSGASLSRHDVLLGDDLAARAGGVEREPERQSDPERDRRQHVADDRPRGRRCSRSRDQFEVFIQSAGWRASSTQPPATQHGQEADQEDAEREARPAPLRPAAEDLRQRHRQPRRGDQAVRRPVLARASGSRPASRTRAGRLRQPPRRASRFHVSLRSSLPPFQGITGNRPGC